MRIALLSWNWKSRAEEAEEWYRHHHRRCRPHQRKQPQESEEVRRASSRTSLRISRRRRSCRTRGKRHPGHRTEGNHLRSLLYEPREEECSLIRLDWLADNANAGALSDGHVVQLQKTRIAEMHV